MWGPGPPPSCMIMLWFAADCQTVFGEVDRVLAVDGLMVAETTAAPPSSRLWIPPSCVRLSASKCGSWMMVSP